MDEAQKKLYLAQLDARYYWIRHTLNRILYSTIALSFFLLAMAIMFLALFYSDELVHTIGDCIGYKDGWIRRPCSQAVRALFDRVMSGEPANFFNL